MRPPRLAERLLNRALPRGRDGDTIRGDLLEEFTARAARSPLRAYWWYWRAAVSMRVQYRAPLVPGGLAWRGGPPFHETLSQDVRYAVRTLLKARAFTLVVLVTLALGIGANTAIFSALNAVLLRPLPYPGAERLVRVVSQHAAAGTQGSHVSAADFTDAQRDAPAFESLAAFATFNVSIAAADGRAGAERIAGAEQVNLFETLGVPPAVGRGFLDADVARSGPATTVIVSDGFARRRFGGNADVAGRPLRPGSSSRIVGVMPRGFAYPENVELWIAGALDPVGDPRSNRRFEAVGRLRPGVTVREAQAQLDAISQRLDTAFPATNHDWRLRAVPLTDYVVGDARRTLVLLFGAVGLVMLVSCANVASLFLAHASRRQREIAVRSAIGASRGRIVRQVLTESILLSLAAGAIGIVIGRWGLDLLIAIGARGIPRLEDAALDRTVLVFTMMVSTITGVLFGLLPALQLSRPSLLLALREGSRGAGTRSRTRHALVVAEVAAALVLLVAAGLLGRSFSGLQRVDVGFDPSNLLTMRVTLGGAKYQQAGPDALYFDEAIRRVSALPGVRSAAAVLALPVGGGGFYLGRGFIRPGREHPLDGYNAGYQIVTPGYFATLGMPLLKGRGFDTRDTLASRQVVVINRTMAERFFPGEDPIGQSVLVWRDEKAPREIIGVVGDLKSEDLTAAPDAELFVPHTQSSLNDMTFVVRTDGRVGAAAVKAAVEAVDRAQAVYDVKPFESIMGDALAQQRFSVMLFSAFAALALALAAVGLYGVMTHVVTGRAHEMGVRLALGARPSQVRGLVVRQGLLLLALGIALGVPAALASARLLGRLLYDVGPADPLTFGTVLATLTLVTWLAAYLPARRATRVDPASALRAE